MNTCSYLQFGFAKHLSCSLAIIVLTQTIDYFLIRNGGEVFMASLDVRKAFDRVNHIKLFDKLIEHGFPSVC